MRWWREKWKGAQGSQKKWEESRTEERNDISGQRNLDEVVKAPWLASKRGDVDYRVKGDIDCLPRLFGGIGGASLVAQMVKNLPSMWKPWVGVCRIKESNPQCLIPGQEDPLEKGMATHSSILAWEIPWTEKPGGLWSVGSQSQT